MPTGFAGAQEAVQLGVADIDSRQMTLPVARARGTSSGWYRSPQIDAGEAGSVWQAMDGCGSVEGMKEDGNQRAEVPSASEGCK